FLSLAEHPQAGTRRPRTQRGPRSLPGAGLIGLQPPAAVRRVGLAHLPQRGTAFADQIRLVLRALERPRLAEATGILTNGPTASNSRLFRDLPGDYGIITPHRQTMLLANFAVADTTPPARHST